MSPSPTLDPGRHAPRRPAPRPTRDPLIMRGCLWLIRLASLLVPRDARAEWRQEWMAEIRSTASARRTEMHRDADTGTDLDMRRRPDRDGGRDRPRDTRRETSRGPDRDRSRDTDRDTSRDVRLDPGRDRDRDQGYDARRGIGRDISLLRRTLGALPDAAWLRRQFTADAEIVRDAGYGLRLLRRSPGFAAIAVLILAIGIGAGTTIFSLVDALLLRDLPYTDADRVVTLRQIDTRRGTAPDESAPGNFADWRERAHAFATLAAAEPFSYDYTGGTEPEVFMAANVTEGFFEAVGITPLLGRTFQPQDYVPGHHRVVVLSHALWQRSFGRRADILGRVITLDAQPFTIVGVLPPSVELRLMGNGAERGLWAPKIMSDVEKRLRAANGWWDVVGRLKPGVSFEQARADLETVVRQLATEFPQTNAGMEVTIVPLRDHLAGAMRTPLLILLGAVGLVLLLACANVANLLLARSAGRMREFAVRTALGASRVRLMRQMLTEGAALAILGAIGGLALTWWGIRFVVGLMPAETPRVASTHIDPRLLAFSLLLTAVTVILFALAPSLQLSRDDRRGMLRSAGAGRTATRQTRGLSKAILVIETAFALLLLVGSGLLFRSFLTLTAVNPGFVKEHVLTMQVFVWDHFRTPDARRAFFADALARMSTLPGVRSAGIASAVPFMPANIGIRSPLIVEDRARPRPGEEPATYITIADAGYFPTLRIPLEQGRLFTDRDTQDAPRVALINHVLKRQLWPTDDPIARHVTITFNGRPTSVEIVGVVGALRHESLDRVERPELFVPHAQVPFGSMTFVIRGDGDPTALTHSLEAQIWAIDRLQPIYNTATLEGLVSESLRERRFSLNLLGLFAVIALVLASMGIYGVVAVSTTQRTQEIGIRVALGASQGRIRGLVLGQGLALVGIGVIVGLGVALVLTRTLRSLLYGISPFDPLTLIGAALVLLIAAAAASYGPARRATRIDPLTALRVD